MIVAAGQDGAIGRKGDLIWHISDDLRRFKSITMGHPVIMGRKTWESLPKRPLPGRPNIVVTRQKDYIAPGATLVSSPEEALGVCAEIPGDDSSIQRATPFVIGGAHIYEAMLPYVTRLYLTQIDSPCPDADAFLPWPLSSDWKIEEVSEDFTTQQGLSYRFATYSR